MLILLATSAVFSQRPVRGIVVEADTDLPLAGAKVKIGQVNMEKLTNADGTFELFFPNAGEMKYSVMLEGYRNVKVKPETGEFRKIILKKKIKPGTTTLDSLPPPKLLPANLGSETDLHLDSFSLLGIQHAAQFIQGQMAGMYVYRPGGNPNEDYLLRLRGLSTFTSQTSPLVVVDGLPESSLYLLDPNDIASIRVLKDAVAASRYGLNGISGVIEVETKKDRLGKPLVRYHGFLSQDFVGRRIPVATPEEFTAFGGLDLGERNFWLSEITRTHFSQGHHLSFSGGSQKFGYAAATGYRNTQGILKHSGFEQMNGRLFVRFSPWKDRLTLHAQGTATNRLSDYSFPEAFRYAITFNPTAPVRSDAPGFQQFGGWFETQLFESLNPLAMLELNRNLGAWQQLAGRAGFDFSLLKKLKISAFYIRNENERLGGRYISPQSAFEAGILRNGSLSLFKDRRTHHLVNATLAGQFTLKNIGLEVTHQHGVDWHRHYYRTTSQQADTMGFIQLNWDNLGENLTGLPARPFLTGARNMLAFFTTWKASWRSFFLNANLRYEGTNMRENIFKYGWFYGATAGVQLSELLQANNYHLRLRLGFGKTGGLFAALNPYLTRGWYSRTEQPLQTNGEFVPSLNFIGNTDFQWEEKQEWNLGADFSIRRFGLHGSVDFYHNTADQLMTVEPIIVQGLLLGYTPFNSGQLTNTGMECSLSATLLKKTDFSWQARFNVFTNRTIVNKFSLTDSRQEYFNYYGYFQAGGAPPRNLLENGQPLGQISGAVFAGVDADGAPFFRDLNKNGWADAYDDVKVLGRATPKLAIGWQNALMWGRFDLNLQFRGVLGHQLVNNYRLARENIGFPTLNFVKTDAFIPNQLFGGGFSDRYLENASFLKLDYLALGYRLPLKKGTCRLYFASQNLLTLSAYRGADPEPRLEAFNNPLYWGNEDGNSYFRNQTLIVGVERSF